MIRHRYTDDDLLAQARILRLGGRTLLSNALLELHELRTQPAEAADPAEVARLTEENARLREELEAARKMVGLAVPPQAKKRSKK
jgi:hypothetical protein